MKNNKKSGSSARSRGGVGAVLCLLAGACAAQASVLEGSGIRFSGFGTLGAVHVQAPEGWGFLRSAEQPASTRNPRFDVDSRLGVQLNYAANEQIEWVGQLLATRRQAGASAGEIVEWAFAAYRPSSDLTLRAGRLNMDQYVMSDYRNVGFAYLYARPPAEYYGSIPSNLDGLDVTRTWNFEDVRWRAKGIIGRSRTTPISLPKAWGLALARESDGLLLRAGWARARFSYRSQDMTALLDGLDQFRAWPIPTVAAEATALRAQVEMTDEPLTYATLGMTYESGPWLTAAEVTRLAFGDALVKAGYASVARRFGDFTWFGMVSSANGGATAVATPAWGAMLAPVIGPAAAQEAQALAATAAYVAGQSVRQTTFSLGGRWDIYPRMALKVQWDHVKVRSNGSYLWANATGDPGNANIATVLLDFIF